MEYLDGQSLQERIDAEEALPPYDVHWITMAVCDSLAEVHTQGLLHRDIKPANVMLASDGSAVVDFGSARTFDHGQTVSHTCILTTGYAAPEMYSTQARFGPYTDLFCLEGTLFHALTGSPHPASIDRLLDHRVGIEFPQDLQGSLSAVTHHALQIAVEDCPQSAADFKAACAEITVPRPAAWELEPPSDVEVWYPATTLLSYILHGHTGRIRDLAFRFDSLTLASAGEDKTIRLWLVSTQFGSCACVPPCWFTRFVVFGNHHPYHRGFYHHSHLLYLHRCNILLIAIAIIVFITDSRQSVLENQTTVPTDIAPQAVATFTSTPSPPTPTVILTATPIPKPTRTPRPTRIPLPVATVTPIPYIVNNNANVRNGPGTNYSIVGSRQQGDILIPVARTTDGEWIQISSVEWIWAGLVDGNIAILPVTHNIPAAPTATPQPTAVPIPPTVTPQPVRQQRTQPTPVTQNNSQENNYQCLTSADRVYLGKVLETASLTIRTRDLLFEFLELLIQDYDFVINNQTWIDGTTDLLVNMQGLHELILLANAPSSMANIHSEALSTMLAYRHAANSFDYGVTRQSLAAISEGLDRLETAEIMFNTFMATLENVCNSR